MKTGTGVENHIWEEIITLARRYEIQRVILFGSRARGDYRRTSDIDLAVSGGNVPAFMIDVEEDVATLLKFDIVDMGKEMQEELRMSILTEGKLIYEKI